MDTINYFVAETDLPEQDNDQAYGPISSSEYRVTSMFSGDQNIMAYAVTSGIVFIVEQDGNADRVNLFLKPDTLSIGIPVRYFVYRGLLKSDFLNGEDIRPATTDDSDFIKNLRKGQHGEEALDLYSDMLATDFINDILVDDDNQFALVKQGDSIGRFDSTTDYGFEIMLDETFFMPTFAHARIAINVIEVFGDDLEVSRLQILNYIDPAAYYGLFTHGAYSIGTNNIASPLSRSKGELYEFIKQFTTKNSIYIDIRDEYENPIDWFADSPKTLKLTTNGSTAAMSNEISYRDDNGFPIKIITNGFSASETNVGDQTYFILTLSLSTINLTTPMLILQAGYWLKFLTNIKDEMIFSICTLTDNWSDDKTFVIYGNENNGADVPIATYIRLELGNFNNLDSIQSQILKNKELDDIDFEVDFYTSGLFPFKI